MCIVVSRKRFYITKEPKRSYKVLFKRNKKLYPPYYYENICYKLNLKYSIPEGEFEETVEDLILPYSSSRITTIGFYSFDNIRSARKLKKQFQNSLFYRGRYTNFVIVECEIPKNTKYISGKERGSAFLGTHKTYCSQSIIIRKILE